MLIRLFIIYLNFAFIYCKDPKGTPCETPNGEKAECVPITSCKVIQQAITYLDPIAVEFAKQSQCGYNEGPLVCCGSVGRPTAPKPQLAPQTEKPRPPPPNVVLPDPVNDLHLPDHTLCGIQSEKNLKKDRIIGGTSATIREFPWMVALKYVKIGAEDDGDDVHSFRCAGTLINHRYVLTAAQCLNISGYNLTEVRLGEWRFSTETDCSEEDDEEDVCADPILDVPVKELIRHPYYTKKDGNNDIALILLEHKVNYTDFIRPICLPKPNLPPPLAGTEMFISGWGVTEDGRQSDVKRKAKIFMKVNEQCILVLPEYIHINPNQACAGGEAGIDACSGDSGGPLMRTYYKPDEGEEEQWYQEGIIYKGLGCGQKGIPGLYTRISRYISWILNNLRYV